MKKKIIAIIISMFFLTGLISISTIGKKTSNLIESEIMISGYSPKGDIMIFGDEDFTEENGVTGGNGTKDDPYIIEGWRVGSIQIWHPTVYFIIRNCYVSFRILFMEVSTGIIEDCIIHTNVGDLFANGIELYESHNNIIRRSLILNHIDGFNLNTCNDNEIYNCTISENSDGIAMAWEYSRNLIHHNNFIGKSWHHAACYGDGHNKWDDGSEGNYWDDYTGEDNDGDGIGDTPYDKILYTSDKDRFPLMEQILFNNNQPPEKPTIKGPVNGKIGEVYEYSFTIVDPDDDQIFYRIEWHDPNDWEDDTFEKWGGPYESGETIILKHKFREKGTYEITACGLDINGAVGKCASLYVTMPKNKASYYNFNLLSWLFERFPNIFPIIRQILGL